MVEIEIDGPLNEALSFRPLPGRTVRGRFDLNRVSEPMARLKSAEWPTPIPGQRLGIGADAVGYVKEPLHDAECSATREKILKSGARLAPPVECFEGVDQASWLYWLKRAVDGGVARVVKGSFPDKITSTPRRNVILAQPPQGIQDKLAAAIEQQNKLISQLVERMAKGNGGK
jgi:hypothetical protein